MGDGDHPKLIIQIDKDQHARKPPQRSMADACGVLNGIGQRIRTNFVERGFEFATKFAAQAGALPVMVVQRLAQLGFSSFVKGDPLHG